MKFNNLEIKNLMNQNLSTVELAKAFDELLTKERSTHNEIKKEYERLNVIINLIPNTISWVNSDMTYFGVNKALADSCNVTTADFVGKTIGFHTKERFFYEFVTELFRSKSDTVYRELEARISGVDRTYLVSGTKLEDKEKAVVIGVDITELTNLKDHVSFTEKLANLGEMFAGIIHDINNPLMMIEGTARRIKKRVTDEEVIDLLSKIEMSSQKISKIVKGIKVYIRQDNDEPFVSENLGSIIDDALVICEHKLKENMVSVVLDPKLHKIEIPCHFTQVFQVFVNLISNSVDAISELQEKSIEITVSETDSKYVIRFQDSGLGIPQDYQEKIFNAFFTTKDRGVGSGLGLSLCRKILEAHGGSLAIDNSAPHTTFLIEFKK
ncbi:HAMP domain-containing sensor histidine kinase [Bacteriovorax sp. PP10]|uniref:histidine kinase n=1 Tax=Bacteriovorax antarcticus TaxID=3088717 RepID=A0ABU5W0I8_9BACT|nr:HAMP domain-containing sensor histidine kinase [Bacteriovorax sp. PP10]MEA9358148.1 HAMP domain-containing sensor histidine kinase [Bacteriovorax sp. PP10]